jgi:hypothetical protein
LPPPSFIVLNLAEPGIKGEVSGDLHLLALGPFESIAIVTPARLLTARSE